MDSHLLVQKDPPTKNARKRASRRAKVEKKKLRKPVLIVSLPEEVPRPSHTLSPPLTSTLGLSEDTLRDLQSIEAEDIDKEEEPVDLEITQSVLVGSAPNKFSEEMGDSMIKSEQPLNPLDEPQIKAAAAVQNLDKNVNLLPPYEEIAAQKWDDKSYSINRKIRFQKLWETGKYSDVNIKVREGEGIRVLKCHKAILSEKGVLSHLLSESETEDEKIANVSLEDRDPAVVIPIIEFLYTGSFKHSGHPNFVLRLYFEAKRFGLTDITDYIIQHLEDRFYRLELKMAIYLFKCILFSTRTAGACNFQLDEFERPIVVLCGRPDFMQIIQHDDVKGILESDGTLATSLLRIYASKQASEKRLSAHLYWMLRPQTIIRTWGVKA